jgi:hypothetical protein
MAEQATSFPSPQADDSGSETAELREELARSREEILRLRDLLIGKDAEIGSLRGRLTEIEGGAAPLIAIAARLRALLPTPAIKAVAGLRGRRGSRD